MTSATDFPSRRQAALWALVAAWLVAACGDSGMEPADQGPTAPPNQASRVVDVAATSVSGSVVTVRPLSAGGATMTVTARDAEGRRLTVAAAAQQEPVRKISTWQSADRDNFLRAVGGALLTMLTACAMVANVGQCVEWKRKTRMNVVALTGVVMALLSFMILFPGTETVVTDDEKTEGVTFRQDAISSDADTIYRTDTLSINQRSSHCNPIGHVQIPVYPLNNWHILQESVTQQLHHNPESSATIVPNDGQGFDIILNVQNRGKCFGPFKDARGVVEGYVHYRQYQVRSSNGS